jgi:hypothetical protein
MQAVPYTGGVVVNFVSKKGDGNVSIELPLAAINQGAARQLQQAISNMQRLEQAVKSDASVENSPIFKIQMIQANTDLEDAMKAVLQYYDAEATK